MRKKYLITSILIIKNFKFICIKKNIYLAGLALDKSLLWSFYKRTLNLQHNFLWINHTNSYIICNSHRIKLLLNMHEIKKLKKYIERWYIIGISKIIRVKWWLKAYLTVYKHKSNKVWTRLYKKDKYQESIIINR